LKFPVRWQIAILLCLITMINYLDRQAFAVAGPVLVDLFALSNTEYGLIGSAFLFAYGIGQLIVGPVVDRFGTKRSFNFAVIAWSIVGILHAVGRGFLSFFLLRALLGITEAMNLPAAFKAVAEWFPQAERSMAVGIVTAGIGLGAIVAPPLLIWLIVSFGWQWAFIVPGVSGFVWLLIWHGYYESPEKHAGISATERDLILADRSPADLASHSKSVVVEPWYGFIYFFGYREVWGLMLSRLASDGAFYFFVAWLPLYLSQERGFDLQALAFSLAIPFVAADVGSLFGGWLGTRLIRAGWSVNAARKTIIWVAALLVPCALLAALVDSAPVAIGLICLAMFAIQMKASSHFTLPADLFPARDVATIWGLFGAVGSLGGALFVVAVGWISEHYSYTPIFAAVGIMHIVSALIIMIMIPEIKPLKQ
jgi:ACS family hexuronate transporter-like MFS transporter